MKVTYVKAKSCLFALTTRGYAPPLREGRENLYTPLGVTLS